jgi:hypothetical protein
MATFTFKLIDTYNDSYTVVRLSQPKPLGHKHEDLKKYSLTTGASTQRPNFFKYPYWCTATAGKTYFAI